MDPEQCSLPTDVRWCSPLPYTGAGGGWAGAEWEAGSTFGLYAAFCCPVICEWHLALLPRADLSSPPMKCEVFSSKNNPGKGLGVRECGNCNTRVFSFWFLQTDPFDLPMLVSYKRIENGYVKNEDAVTNLAERYPLRILWSAPCKHCILSCCRKNHGFNLTVLFSHTKNSKQPCW